MRINLLLNKPNLHTCNTYNLNYNMHKLFFNMYNLDKYYTYKLNYNVCKLIVK